MADNTKRKTDTFLAEDAPQRKKAKPDSNIPSSKTATILTVATPTITADEGKGKGKAETDINGSLEAGVGKSKIMTANRERIFCSPPSDSDDEDRAPRMPEVPRRGEGSGKSFFSSPEKGATVGEGSGRGLFSTPEKDVTVGEYSESHSESDGDDTDEDIVDSSPVKYDNESTSRKKNAPVAKRGSKFLWADNESYRNIIKAPFKVGVQQPDMLKITLKDVNGKETTWIREGHENPQWDNAEWIKKTNSWWGQLIARKLNRPNPETSTARKSRPAWAESEMQYIKQLCELKLKKSQGSKLSRADMGVITKQHNDHFEGHEFGIGEKLLLVDEGKEYKRARKPAVTSAYVFTPRTTGGVISMIKRFPDTKIFMEEGPVSSASASASASGSTPKRKEKKRPLVVDRRTVVSGDVKKANPDEDAE